MFLEKIGECTLFLRKRLIFGVYGGGVVEPEDAKYPRHGGLKKPLVFPYLIEIREAISTLSRVAML